MKQEIKIEVIGAQSTEEAQLYIDWLHLSDIFNGANIVITEQNPDFVFVVYPLLYANDIKYLKNMDKLLNLDDSVIRIGITGEAIFPDFNLLDYAFCFDDKIEGERIIRPPILDFWGDDIAQALLNRNIKEPQQLLKEKEFFCNYIYSAYQTANPYRGNLFQEISKYKFVHSPGVHFNNTTMEVSRNDGNWRIGSSEYKQKFKFSIASENNTYSGYTTEKLLTSMQANTIPIYWGNPNVEDEFNEKSFINCHKYSSIEDVVKRIKEIDRDDDLWCEIISEPCLTEEQIEIYHLKSKKWKNKLKNILAENQLSARKRGDGASYKNYIEIYKERNNSCIEAKSNNNNFFKKIFRKR